jgi:biotin transport system substrate-specific component
MPEGFMQSHVSTRAALAPTLWSFAGNRTLQDVVLVLAGTALIAISAKIKVPFYPVPMTLQTLAIILIGSTYGFRLATLTLLAYLGEGLAGLPVFTNTPPAPAGPLYFLGPTGGFLVGFLLLAMIVGYATDRGWDRSAIRLFAAAIVGQLVLFALGVAWLAWFASLSSGTVGLGVEKAIAVGVTPFIWGGLLKTAFVALLVPATWTLLKRRDG